MPTRMLDKCAKNKLAIMFKGGAGCNEAKAGIMEVSTSWQALATPWGLCSPGQPGACHQGGGLLA